LSNDDDGSMRCVARCSCTVAGFAGLTGPVALATTSSPRVEHSVRTTRTRALAIGVHKRDGVAL
jgi:hypothetical protein